MNRSRAAATTLVILGLALTGCSSGGAGPSVSSQASATQEQTQYERAGKVQIIAGDNLGMAAMGALNTRSTAFAQPRD